MATTTDYTNSTRDSDLLDAWIKTQLAEVVNAGRPWQSVSQELWRQLGRPAKKSELLARYQALCAAGRFSDQPAYRRWLRSKPIRTLSGVAPVTVLTKPYPCPGECIFCPNDIRMPKSYLADEPGAQRAERNWFDPYLQTYARLEALATIGHSLDKVELIVLGGTWSFYPEQYQIWFIDGCFQALNDWSAGRDGRTKRLEQYQQVKVKLEAVGGVPLSDQPTENERRLREYELAGGDVTRGSYNRRVAQLYSVPEKKLGLDELQSRTWEELAQSQQINETARARCVGLVLETRPDEISEAEVIRLRRLGCTKAQIGVQSTQDTVLLANKRGHDVAATRRAFSLLRQAGFKIHAHWMANLYGSTPEQDQADFSTLVTDLGLQPDELKLYPCSLIGTAELMQYYQDGRWRPYTEEELLGVLKSAMLQTPAYCRLTRIIRDIPSQYIVEGNKKTNFRQLVDQLLAAEETHSADIRAREIRDLDFDRSQLQLITRRYDTAVSDEFFLEWNLPSDRHPFGLIAGFLRLSLPKNAPFIDELIGAAMIREVHIYGEALPIGQRRDKAQHRGLGQELIAQAKHIAHEHGFQQLAVISAVGTRGYYRAKGFTDGQLYQFMR